MFSVSVTPRSLDQWLNGLSKFCFCHLVYISVNGNANLYRYDTLYSFPTVNKREGCFYIYIYLSLHLMQEKTYSVHLDPYVARDALRQCLVRDAIAATQFDLNITVLSYNQLDVLKLKSQCNELISQGVITQLWQLTVSH